jgi:large subunit ribosomal protein L35
MGMKMKMKKKRMTSWRTLCVTHPLRSRRREKTHIRACARPADRYRARPMPKSIARRKTKKAVAKRFKITATGKILRRKPGLRHLASSKSSKRKRNLGKSGQVHKTMVARVMECLPFG